VLARSALADDLLLLPPASPGFDLSLAVDASLLGASAAMFGAALLLNHAQSSPVRTGDPSGLWRIDRVAIGRDNASQDAASTVIQDVLVIGAPLGLALSEWQGSPKSLAPAFVVAESILASSALNQLTKSLVRRPRPYTYGQGLASGSAARSFYSGHTTTSFAAVTSLTVVLHELHPDSSVPWLLGAAGLSAATTVGVLRVTSGKHFPTDVAVGAVTGLAIGWAVPMLHRRPRTWGLTVAPDQVAVSGQF
jgi:membrane-associated phospholipid phosphatase